MKGDFSRFTFDRRKHYTGVRLQQGRVQLDADWNEQADIGAHLRHTLAADLIGASGAPFTGGGFEVTVAATAAGPEVRVSPGRFYAAGILVENEAAAPLSLTQQPELPGYALPTAVGRYLAYLDVWERSVTVLEDPDILELALGGPDTATRTRIIWQVKLAAVAADQTSVADTWQPDPRTLPTLAARAVAGSNPQENQLYRIEVHEPAVLDAGGAVTRPATFKWSRDNAAVAARIQNPATNSEENRFQIVITRQVGPDQAGGFATGQWIEVTDEDRILRGQPGILAKLSSVAGQVLSVEGWPGAGDPVPDLPNQPTIRRWDSDGGSRGALDIDLPAGGGTTTIDLDGSVEILIGGTPGAFRSGDYWVVATRAAAGVLWPVDGAGNPVPAEPPGIRHHYAPLAILDRAGSSWSVVPVPVRKVFRGTTVIPGPEKLNRTENDTMTASLVITGDLTVNRKVTVGVSGTPGGELELRDGPLVLAQGNNSGRGLRFAGTGSFLRDDPASSRMTLGANGPTTSLALSQNGSERLTITSAGRVGIRTSTPQQDVHVRGGVILLQPDASVQVEKLLVYRDQNQKEGRVLTSDKDGNATWQDLPIRKLGVPMFLDFPLAVSGGGGTVGWTTWTLSGDKIPSDASAVILDVIVTMDQPDGRPIDVAAQILVRKSPNDPEIVLIRGASASDGDSIAWGGQGLCPIRGGQFQYTVTWPGFNWGWRIRVVGYFP